LDSIYLTLQDEGILLRHNDDKWLKKITTVAINMLNGETKHNTDKRIMQCTVPLIQQQQLYLYLTKQNNTVSMKTKITYKNDYVLGNLK
jgi:hypothetical protein